MVGYWLDVILCSITVGLELLGAIIIALLIQLISYRIFNFNIYKNIDKGLKKLDKYLTNLLG